MDTNFNIELPAVSRSNTYTTACVAIHPLHQFHHPLLNPQLSHCPPNILTRHSVEGFLQINKGHVKIPVDRQILFLKLPHNKNCISGAPAWDKTKLTFVNDNSLPDHVVNDSFKDLQYMFSQLQSSVIPPIQCIPFTLIQTDYETFLPVLRNALAFDDRLFQMNQLLYLLSF